MSRRHGSLKKMKRGKRRLCPCLPLSGYFVMDEEMGPAKLQYVLHDNIWESYERCISPNDVLPEYLFMYSVILTPDLLRRNADQYNFGW
jgi:hypothetical protein